jgi:hypothetical protein
MRGAWAEQHGVRGWMLLAHRRGQIRGLKREKNRNAKERRDEDREEEGIRLRSFAFRFRFVSRF